VNCCILTCKINIVEYNKYIEDEKYEELHNLYSYPNIIRQVKSRGIRWAGHVARMGQERIVYKVLMGKPEGKRPLGRPRRKWEDEIGRCWGDCLGGC
jgi:hypothetical protein